MAADSRPPGPDWLDVDAGPVVRPYTVTGGRVRPERGFDLVAFVVAAPLDRVDLAPLQPEHRLIIEVAQRPVAVAELAARVDLALGVVRILLSDLLSAGLVVSYEPQPAAALPNHDILQAVVNGLRAL
ncbi:uncharacterized protein DUF742 [Asanoa ferruginea]|uniref:Uncharacterized protein DUF742 n=1 Tax=Asanoa ferruginea TaxID=53367 RepID=A0A3D9ZB61_9ACTN|nr:DUF742 domain-containing protein [Asanoa ferruginea]REF94535.1 uncharacterized protein DUF742 [Asanoa ferruginea]GIF51579.1 hypothetical protein Afe04nite_61180 [Asanoa ferruginea]